MKVFGLLAAIACSVMAAGPAMASSSSGGYVQNLSVGSDGSIWFAYSGGAHYGSWPACAASNGLWAVSASSAGSQKVLAALMTASTGRLKISIQGTGACYNDHEEVAYVMFES